MLDSMGIDEDESTQALMEQMKASLRESFGEDALKSSIEQSTRVSLKPRILKWVTAGLLKIVLSLL